MILLIDNYDSFTYNLYQAIGQLYENIKVVRNDKINIKEIEKLNPKAIIISPGPGFPDSAGVSLEAIRYFSPKIPILGVCLGHQSICQVFGGKVIQAREQLHGKSSEIDIDLKCPIFSGLSDKISVGRYHSLIVDKTTLPSYLSITAKDNFGEIMAIKHNEYPTYGLQFHPESILTDSGMKIIENFISTLSNPIQNNSKKDLDQTNKNGLKKFIFKVIDGENLSQDEAFSAMECIMSGNATDSQISSFITALRMKGETIDEITGFAKVMREKSKKVIHSHPAVDIVGTGGDMANTFNISTTSSFVIAGAGLKVAKHGNRSVSSKSGSADVLEALGVKIKMDPQKASSCLDECGISFLFAPNFHGSMKFAATPRREIGVRSVFNILGPLASPALAEYIILGVYEEDLLEPMARVLMNIGIKGAMIVHGSDGLDEITISDTTKICEIKGEKLIKYELDPRDYGFKLSDKSEVVGGSAYDNSLITLDILNGKTGPTRDIVLLNAGCAIYISGKASTIAEGIEMAKKSIDSGAALSKLEELKTFSNSF